VEVLIVNTALLAAGAAAIGFAFFIRQGKSPDPVGSDPLSFWSPTSYSYEVTQLAQAIARAEGFYQSGSAPARAHNPGAIKVPGWTGPVTGSEGISVFTSDAQGWEALYRQLDLIADGRSGIYTLGMTITDMARRWTATAQSSWATTVASSLGVSTNTKLSQVLA
jgi:hypothetical protein